MRRLGPALVISLLLVMSSGCLQLWEEEPTHVEEMRSLVQGISSYARDRDPDFIVVVANGEDLAIDGGRTAKGFLASIDGVAREDLYFGSGGLDIPTPWSRIESMASRLNVSKDAGKVVMAVDRCSQPGYIWDASKWAESMGFLYYASNTDDMDTIPDYPADPHGANRGNVSSLSQARNLVVLAATNGHDSRAEYLESLRQTNFDVLVIDAFYNKTPLTTQEVNSLRVKKDGGTRLVVAVVGLGQVDERQAVWKEQYVYQPPGWLGKDVTGEDGKHWVKYWEKDWRNVLFKSEGSWLDQVLDLGFDGVYLLGGDAHKFS
jgi:cysteinyl-tRNA synthetase